MKECYNGKQVIISNVNRYNEYKESYKLKYLINN